MELWHPPLGDVQLRGLSTPWNDKSASTRASGKKLLDVSHNISTVSTESYSIVLQVGNYNLKSTPKLNERQEKRLKGREKDHQRVRCQPVVYRIPGQPELILSPCLKKAQ